MMYATIFVCSLTAAAPCKGVPIPVSYPDEAACYAEGWKLARAYEKHKPGWKVEGVGCSPTPPSESGEKL